MQAVQSGVGLRDVLQDCLAQINRNALYASAVGMGRGAIDAAMNLLEMALESRLEVLTISTAGWRALCCSGCLLQLELEDDFPMGTPPEAARCFAELVRT